MAEKQPKTCEEYVLNVLADKEVELVTTQKLLQKANQVHDELKTHHIKMFELLVLALGGARVVKEDNITSIYLDCGYIGCYSDYGLESKEKDDMKLYALAQLIELVKRTPTRED